MQQYTDTVAKHTVYNVYGDQINHVKYIYRVFQKNGTPVLFLR